MNIERFSDEKVLRDPIHGYIRVHYKLIWDCIESKEFQRLKRIRQLGGDFQVYPTSDHTRFSHSLGVYEIVRRLLSEIPSIDHAMSEEEKLCTMLAALLHDLGHGPYSHVFEEITEIHHETWTIDILKEDTEIHQVLSNVSDDLIEGIQMILEHRHPNPLCNQLISGQIDADRMDYLLRDSYFTGTTYGKFDMERIFRVLDVKDDILVVKESGIMAVEDYIMSRYYMYWQVYFHPAAKGFDGMLILLFKRMKDLYKEGNFNLDKYPMFDAFVGNRKITYDDMIAMDDCSLNYGVSLLADDPDEILSDLAYRLHNRKLFTYVDNDEKFDVQSWVKDLNYNVNYYTYKATAINLPYRLGREDEIQVLDRDGKIRELSTVSPVVKAILDSDMKADKKTFYPKEKLKRFLKRQENNNNAI